MDGQEFLLGFDPDDDQVRMLLILWDDMTSSLNGSMRRLDHLLWNGQITSDEQITVFKLDHKV